MIGYVLPADAEERRIIDAIAAGDAFDRLYREYAAPLRAFCRSRLGNLTDAEDACHETMVKAYGNLGRFQTDRRLWPWLSTIAANVCRDMQRRQAVALAKTPRDEGVRDDLEEQVALRARRALIGDALSDLPARYRDYIRLRDLEGWSYEDIAEWDHTSVATVRSTLHRGRRVLRERVKSLASDRRQWPLPAVVPGLVSRVRSSLSRGRAAVTHQLSGSVGWSSPFDALATMLATPGIAQGVLSVTALVGLGAGVLSTTASAEDGVVPADPVVIVNAENVAAIEELYAAVVSAPGPVGGRTDRGDGTAGPTPPTAAPAGFASDDALAAPEVAPTAPAAPDSPVLDAPPAPSAPRAVETNTSLPAAPTVQQTDDNGTTSYELKTPDADATLLPDDAPTPVDVDNTELGVSPCPPPDERGELTTAVCEAADDPMGADVPSTGSAIEEVADPAETELTTGSL